MREIKEMVFCVAPFVVTMAVMYLLGSFVSASWDVVEWERTDRVFFGFMSVVFGYALLFRLDYGRKYE